MKPTVIRRSWNVRGLVSVPGMILLGLVTRLGAAEEHAAADEAIVRHSLVVRVDPAGHRVEVRDHLSVPAALVTPRLRLLLNADLKLTLRTPGRKLVLLQSGAAAAAVGMDRDADGRDNPVRVNVYRVDGVHAGAAFAVDLDYAGAIDNPIRDSDTQYARGFSQSPAYPGGRTTATCGTWTHRPRRSI